MKERPILFSAPMVRAILEGRKTQTRRIVKNPDSAISGCDISRLIDQPSVIESDCPYGQPGDQLWVRESFSVRSFDPGYSFSHEGGEDFEYGSCMVEYPDDGSKKRINDLCLDNDGIDEVAQAHRASKKKSVPSIHMPRWASRIQLDITGVRVERLQEISNEDIRAEGACKRSSCTHRLDFQLLWESINGQESWQANPWVWVLEFKRVGGAS